jgi:hypothetical protein
VNGYALVLVVLGVAAAVTLVLLALALARAAALGDRMLKQAHDIERHDEAA